MLRQKLSAWLVARNLVLIVLAGALLAPAGARALAPLDYATVTFGAATLLLLYAAANVALANAAATRLLAGS